MKEELISFETAKIAKEKGFNVYSESRLYFTTKGKPVHQDEYRASDCIEDRSTNDYKRPTQSLLQKWLREEHGIYVNIEVMPCSGLLVFNYLIRYLKDIGKIKISRHIFKHETYEQALEEGLQEALKLTQ